MDELYIGLMSGTSNDGIDACLVNLSPQQFELLDTCYQPYPEEIKTQLDKLVSEQTTSLSALSALDHSLAVLNALAVNKLLQSSNVNKNSISAIGYHGQTIHHEPKTEIANSIQIGDPNFLAARTQIPVVADFRRMDMAVAGQGAPLVPAFHRSQFHAENKNRAILNIGGIANLTILPMKKAEAVTGFDTGPGNTLLNEWNQRHQHSSFDDGGQWAAKGQCLEPLLQKLLDDDYFSKPPPKSTGREYFNLSWLEQKFELKTQKPQDVQTTLAHLSAQSIAKAIVNFAPSTQQVFVCGGGVHNKYLIDLLTKQLGPIELASTENLGLHPDWVEASAFAWLAQQRLAENAGNIASVTGASKAVLLGAIYKSS